MVTFTPTANLSGTGAASFDYTVQDPAANTDTGHVTINITNVDDDPRPRCDDTATVDEDSIDNVIDVLGNDTDPEGGALTVTAVSNVVGGTVDLTAGVVTFTPTANLSGTGAASFDYTVQDPAANTDTGHVTINITNVDDDAPTAVDDTATVDEDSIDNVIDVLGNDTDPEGGALTVTAVSNVVGGTVDLTAGMVTFTPTANLSGTGAASFDYTVQDPAANTDTGHVTINITNVDDDAPTAVDDTATVDEDSIDNVIDVLGNDTDPEGGALTVTAVSNVVGGTVDLTAGVVTFTPTANLSGTGAASFDYTVQDPAANTDTGHVTINITNVDDDAPTAVDDTATVDEDSIDNVIDVLGNDTDPEGGALTVTAVSNVVGGTVDLTAGMVTFTPTANLSGTGAASFDYTV